MAHGKHVQWSRHLLMYALERERKLESGEASVVRPIRKIPWHPASDVLTSATPELKANGQRAAARALRQLEERRRPLVTVARGNRNIASYQLTRAGRTRAIDLIENGGRTAKSLQREAASTAREQAALEANHKGHATAAGYARLRTFLQEGLLTESGRYLKPVLDMAPRQPIPDPYGRPALTYWDVPLSPKALSAVEDPLDRLILHLHLLAWITHSQRDSKANLDALHEAIAANDAAWPAVRDALIESGELETLTLRPGGIDWVDVPGFWTYPGMRELPGDTLANPLLRQVLLDRFGLSETV